MGVQPTVAVETPNVSSSASSSCFPLVMGWRAYALDDTPIAGTQKSPAASEPT